MLPQEVANTLKVMTEAYEKAQAENRTVVPRIMAFSSYRATNAFQQALLGNRPSILVKDTYAPPEKPDPPAMSVSIFLLSNGLPTLTSSAAQTS